MKQIIDTQLKEFAGDAGIRLSEIQLQQFYDYFELLTEWNQVMNLTAITEPREVALKHFADSLTLVYVEENLDSRATRLIDVGTGAGFPGIPLKIAFPNLRVTLLDSLNKRVRFLDEVCEKLNLKEIQAVHGRAEDFGRDPLYREKYDICVSRAVANLATLSEYCLPFVKEGGSFISYKSEKAEEELPRAKSAIRVLGGSIVDVKEFLLKGEDAKRVLVRIDKVEKTAKKYPRKSGVPGKEPIGWDV